MNGLFYDRLSGKALELVSETRALVGRWILHVPVDEDVHLNSAVVGQGDFLVPESSGAWRIVDRFGEIQKGLVPQYQLPEENESDGIRAIGRHIEDLIEKGVSWLELVDVIPLVPDMSEKADLTRFEATIGELVGHLEAVCMRPRAHLHVDVERVPVEKARRLPIKAASYLASHSEDWERPLIGGVLPKRVLSEVRQDQVDIYENRVSARLVDNLTTYLSKRIRQLKKLLKVFQDKEDYSRAIGGTYLRQKRIMKLWGQSIDANEGRKRAKATLKELEWLKYRLMGLMDSPLYRDVPRRTYVAPTLRTTNILTNDQNYRRVAQLWRAWVSAGHAKTKTPADVHRESQELCRGIDSFALLLVVRALDQLGYMIRECDFEAPLMMPGRWELDGHGTRVTCSWDDAGKITIEMGTGSITFLPIPASIGAAGTDEQLQEVVDQVVEAVNDKEGERTIVLYVGDTVEEGSKLSLRSQRRIQSVGNDPRLELLDRIGFLPVSPWDIGSVERVSRALRWFVDSNRFDAYPMMLDVPAEARDVVDSTTAGTWLDVSDKGAKLLIRRPPRDFEWDHLQIENHLEGARKEYEQTFAEHQRLSEELKKADRKGVRKGALHQQTKDARIRRNDGEKRLEAVELLHQQLSLVRPIAEALLVCPACGKTSDPGIDFKPRANGCFRCDCQECRTRWATRMCKNGHRYAVMLPGDFVEADDTVSGWEDRIYGSDLLALPGRTANGSWGFVCPVCGEIS